MNSNITDEPLSAEALDEATALFSERGHLLDAADREFVATVLLTGRRVNVSCCDESAGGFLLMFKYSRRDNFEGYRLAGELWDLLQ